MKESKPGFTLAEILLTLSVVGVVAMVALPGFLENVNGRLLERAKADTLTKLKETANSMAMNNVLVGYATNEAFANEFQKYMKVSQRCDSSNLDKCFPSKFKLVDGTEMATSNLTEGTKLSAANSSAPTVGFGLANGTLMIMALKALTGNANDACLKLDPMAGNTASEETLSCMSILYDVNGLQGPNTVNKDIFSINADFNLAPTCTQLGSICVANLDTDYGPINTCSDGTAEDQAFDPTGDANTSCAKNYWAGGKKACAAKGMQIPKMSSDYIHNGDVCPSNATDQLCIMYNNRVALGMDTTVAYWSNTEFTEVAGFPPTHVWHIDMGTGKQMRYIKSYNLFKLRCVQ